MPAIATSFLVHFLEGGCRGIEVLETQAEGAILVLDEVAWCELVLLGHWKLRFADQQAHLPDHAGETQNYEETSFAGPVCWSIWFGSIIYAVPFSVPTNSKSRCLPTRIASRAGKGGLGSFDSQRGVANRRSAVSSKTGLQMGV